MLMRNKKIFSFKFNDEESNFWKIRKKDLTDQNIFLKYAYLSSRRRLKSGPSMKIGSKVK